MSAQYVPKKDWVASLSKAIGFLESMMVHGQYTAQHVQAKAIITMVSESIKMQEKIDTQKEEEDKQKVCQMTSSPTSQNLNGIEEGVT